MNYQEWLAEVVRRIRISEGVRSTMYHDSKGIPTIGAGFNLERGDARDALAKVGADYDAVMAGAALTDAQIDGLLAYALEPVIVEARNSLEPTHFDKWLSDARRFVVVDLVYNLGNAGWLEFAQTRAFIDQGCHDLARGHSADAHASFGAAADHLRASQWFQDVGPNRGGRNVAMMANSTWVDANGDGSA